jgi:hypothetical protein
MVWRIKTILLQEQKHCCVRCSLESVTNVEAEVTASHVHVSWCTEINNLNMAGTMQRFAHVMNTSVQYAMAENLLSPKTWPIPVPVQEYQLAAYKENPEDKSPVGVLIKVLHYMASGGKEKKISWTRHIPTMRQRLPTQYQQKTLWSHVYVWGTCCTIICSNTHQDSMTQEFRRELETFSSSLSQIW